MRLNMKLKKSGLSAAVFLMLSFAAGCDGNGGNSTTPPTVLSNSAEFNVPLNGNANVTFSEAMDGATITSTTFTVTSGLPAVPVQGTVIYSDSKATFWPSAHLTSFTTYTATVTIAAENASGVALEENHTWEFTTGDTLEAGLAVNLGTAGNFVILAKAGIDTVPTSDVRGDMGVSPVTATAITGFSLTLDASNRFSTSAQVTGEIFASTYSPPTPAYLTTAVSDMELAFTDAAGRAPDVTELLAGLIGGQTLVPGVYKWGTGVQISADVYLDGSATDVWILQIAQNLTMASATMIHLTGGALAKNVFWQVGGSVEIGTTAHLEGVVLCQTMIDLRAGASVTGRLLAQTAVNISGSDVFEPAP